jgi:hypothetical protein
LCFEVEVASLNHCVSLPRAAVTWIGRQQTGSVVGSVRHDTDILNGRSGKTQHNSLMPPILRHSVESSECKEYDQIDCTRLSCSRRPPAEVKCMLQRLLYELRRGLPHKPIPDRAIRHSGGCPVSRLFCSSSQNHLTLPNFPCITNACVRFHLTFFPVAIATKCIERTISWAARRSRLRYAQSCGLRHRKKTGNDAGTPVRICWLSSTQIC